MVARSSSSVAAFAPAERPHIAVAADGTLAAILEPSCINVVEVPSCAAFAELGTDPDALGCDVAWVGTPPRLLVLSRFETHSTAHLVDPLGPRTVAEIRLEASMRLCVAVGGHALAVGTQGAAILAATDRQLTPYQFPARTVPLTAGAAGAQFIVALPGAIEEWDPASRLPKRRLKLPRPVNITAVGGSDRVVWMTTTQEPSRIDVIPLVNRGQPKAHDLPEPIAAIAGHPRSDLVACLGATSGRIWVVDLDGRTGLRLVGPVGIDRAEAVGIVLGRVAGVIAAQAEHAVTVVALERTEAADPAQSPTAQSHRTPAPRAAPADAAALSSAPTDAAAPSSAPTDAAAPTSAPTKRSTLYGDDDQAFVDEAATSVSLAMPPLLSPPLASHAATAPSPSASPSPSPSPSPVTAAPAKPFARPPLPAFSESLSADAGGVASAGPRDVAGGGEGRSEGPRDVASAPPRDVASAIHRDVASAGHRDVVGAGPREAASADHLASASVDALEAWRERIHSPRARTVEPFASLWPDASPTWRETIATWAREASSGVGAAGDGVGGGCAPTEAIAQRFELRAQLVRVIALMYGHHLLGIDDSAPVDIARVLGGGEAAWSEALGRGELVARGVATMRGSRLHLSDAVVRALDDHPPRCGTLVGSPGMIALLGPCVIVAEGPIGIVAEGCLASIGGAILAGEQGCDVRELIAEARAYGAAPMWRVDVVQLEHVPAGWPVILVVDSDAAADALGVPRLA